MTIELDAPLRQAVLDTPGIAARLAIYKGFAPAVFTRRPVPSEAVYPMVVISSNIAVGDMDFLTSRLPIVLRDVAVYGQQETVNAGQQDQYRDVELMGDLLRDLFHRRPDAIVVSGYHVVNIVVSGPSIAPTDDERIVGRVVTLTLTLQKE